MNRHNQKKLIAILLFISCLFSTWLLFVSPANESRQFRSFTQADSLLQRTLSDFNIPEQQRSSSAVNVDSNFSRKTYRVTVPPSFSKTQFHAVLQNRLRPYQITLPASVTFPEQDMQIHLRFSSTIIGTIKLSTDKDLTLERSFASLIIAFDNHPYDASINTIKSFGEPIPIAVKMQPPFEKPGWWDELREQYPSSLIWPVATNGNNMLTDDQQNAISSITPLEESFANATLLSFFNDNSRLSTARNQISCSFIPVNNAIIFNDQMNESEFNQTFRTFVQQARNGVKPVAIIIGTEQTLQWTRQQLNTFKKGGLFIVPPNNM